MVMWCCTSVVETVLQILTQNNIAAVTVTEMWTMTATILNRMNCFSLGLGHCTLQTQSSLKQLFDNLIWEKNVLEKEIWKHLFCNLYRTSNPLLAPQFLKFWTTLKPPTLQFLKKSGNPYSATPGQLRKPLLRNSWTTLKTPTPQFLDNSETPYSLIPWELWKPLLRNFWTALKPPTLQFLENSENPYSSICIELWKPLLWNS